MGKKMEEVGGVQALSVGLGLAAQTEILPTP